MNELPLERTGTNKPALAGINGPVLLTFTTGVCYESGIKVIVEIWWFVVNNLCLQLGEVDLVRWRFALFQWSTFAK